MKTFGAATLVAFLLAFGSNARTQQSQPDTQMKQVSTTLPGGEPIIMNAVNIDRNWATGTTHLQGNVQVDIRQSVRAGTHYLVIRADEADFNANTGELVPRGSVRIAPEERR